MTNNVILLHGLYASKFAMYPLGKRLAKHDFTPHYFGYYSVAATVATHSRQLNNWLIKRFAQQGLKNEPFHFVGHSLGGLVIRDFLYRYPDWHTHGQVGRIVTIGTPHLGSSVAKRLQPLFPTFIGKSFGDALDGNLAAWELPLELGIIAGNKSSGLGRLVLPKTDEANDGTVLLSETYLPNATDHIVVPFAHAKMPFTPEVAAQTAYFLENGKFRP